MLEHVLGFVATDDEESSVGFTAGLAAVVIVSGFGFGIFKLLKNRRSDAEYERLLVCQRQQKDKRHKDRKTK